MLNNSSSPAGFVILDVVQGAKRSKGGALARLYNATIRHNAQIPAARGIVQYFRNTVVL